MQQHGTWVRTLMWAAAVMPCVQVVACAGDLAGSYEQDTAMVANTPFGFEANNLRALCETGLSTCVDWGNIGGNAAGGIAARRLTGDPIETCIRGLKKGLGEGVASRGMPHSIQIKHGADANPTNPGLKEGGRTFSRCTRFSFSLAQGTGTCEPCDDSNHDNRKVRQAGQPATADVWTEWVPVTSDGELEPRDIKILVPAVQLELLENWHGWNPATSSFVQEPIPEAIIARDLVLLPRSELLAFDESGQIPSSEVAAVSDAPIEAYGRFAIGNDEFAWVAVGGMIVVTVVACVLICKVLVAGAAISKVGAGIIAAIAGAANYILRILPNYSPEHGPQDLGYSIVPVGSVWL